MMCTSPVPNANVWMLVCSWKIERLRITLICIVLRTAILLSNISPILFVVIANIVGRNKDMSEFEVYEPVWIMEGNGPKKKLVFAVVHSMNFSKTGVETHYQLVNSRVGAGWGNYEGVRRSEKAMFPTKETLLGSL
jgi:hypothetical protein